MDEMIKERAGARLGNNATDRAAAITRSLVGAVPFAGPALAEMITAAIPNQRLDRVEAFLVLLAQELERLNAVAGLAQPSNIPLVEEGIAQAARAFSVERREYLAKCVAQGVGASEMDKAIELKLLQMLGELADDELLLLYAYSGDDWVQRVQQRQTAIISGSGKDYYVRSGVEKASIRKLETLGLLTLGGIDERSKARGEKPVRLSNVSALGEMILSRAGLGARPEA